MYFTEVLLGNNDNDIDNNNNDIDVNKKIRNLFYENKFTEFKYVKNLQCLQDEENFYTPISYEKQGIAVLISVLDYEGLNPFSRIKNSEYKEVKNLRNLIEQNILCNNERYKSSLYYQNMYKKFLRIRRLNPFMKNFVRKLIIIIIIIL